MTRALGSTDGSNHALLNYEASLSVFGALKLGKDPQTIFL